MYDPNYMAVNPHHEPALDEGVCKYCGGVMEGFVGFPGEYHCKCYEGIMMDIQQEEYQLRKRGAR